MISRSEPLLLPLFFTFCIHLGFLLFFSYWSGWQAESRLPDLKLGHSLSATLTTIQPIAKPKPPAVEKPQPPQAVEKQEKARPQESALQKSTPQESTLNNLIEDLKKTKPTSRREEDLVLPAESVEETVTTPVKEDEQQRKWREEALVYYHRNQRIVERNFNPGTSAQKKRFQGLKTRLKIFLNEKGQLMNVEVISSSGNAVFDVEAERAVRRTRKFIVPEDTQLRERYFRTIIMEFSLTR